MRRKREAPAGHVPAKSAGRHGQPASDRFALVDQVLAATVTMLVVATPLIPSEATVHEGTAAPLNFLWTVVLFAWAAALVLRPDPQIKFGWTGIAAAALIGWHTLSGMVAVHSANGRQALNMTWQMLCYGVAAFLLRQLLRTPVQCRAIVAVMIAIASLEAAQGSYEYFLSKPAALAAFRANPEKAFRELNLVTPTQQEHFRWRVESKEPMATFALANSLAGLLAPWLIFLLGIVITFLEGRAPWRAVIGPLVIAAILGGCLLLTKSRTAVLAAGVGIVLLTVYGRSSGWRIGWRLPLAVVLAAVVIGLGVVAVGGLDVQVLSEAPTSVLYRLQYWRSTAAMIADAPLLGCGPGQFQETYATYKLPEASETPRDPHNFLLEIWSTAGTPALVAMLAMAVAVAYQLSQAPSATAAPPAARESANGPSSRLWFYGGAIAGIVLAWPLGIIVGFPPELVPIGGNLSIPGIWLIGLPTALLCLWLLDSWVAAGKLPIALPVLSLFVLLVNLLAAGATSFPGVFLTVWLLATVALANANAPAWNWTPSRAGSLGLLAATALLAWLCMQTEFSPVLAAPNRIAAAEKLLASGRFDRASEQLLAAASEDPWSPEPQRLLAISALQQWLASKSRDDWQRFQQATAAYQRLAPRHHAVYTERGHWLLEAWRTTGNAALLDDAIEAYRQAVLWYPGRALERAQLAWALHLAGRADQARAAADEAKRLDDRTPHRELKLSRQMVYDPLPGSSRDLALTRNAEQALEQIRTGKQPSSSLP